MHRLGISGAMVVVGVLLACKGTNRETADSVSTGGEPAAATASTTSREWYVGGTLHKKGALDWQKASRADKLATCADIVVGIQEKGRLRPGLLPNNYSPDDVKPLAVELMQAIDTACEKKADPQLNRQIYANQKVAEIAVMIMVLAKWTEL